ncbi:MAG: hypothetical protein JJ896_10335 [Rhodothermales bacterium]|nr:hypothetical protein [Rhodothermales bacterium]MBO6780038.1 hypothetical protein [Rhodothermales bacterium]
MPVLAENLPNEAPTSHLTLAWENPEPSYVDHYERILLAECRHRSKAMRILESLPTGWMVEKRRGDRLMFQVFVGAQKTPRIQLHPVRLAA